MTVLARTLARPRHNTGSARTRREVYTTALSHGLFVLVPLMFSGFVLYAALHIHAFAVDFHHAEWPAGQRLLHGASPYPGAHSPAVLAAGTPGAMPFVYPGVGALLYGGLALIPRHIGDGLFTALDMIAVFVALRLTGVRDWRLYGLVFLWPAVVIGWQTANLTLLLCAGLAGVWYLRDRPGRSGALLALLISLKIVLWPVAVWLLATRRYRAVAWTLASGLALNVVAWALVGYSELPRYLSLLQSFNHAAEGRAYSVINLGLHLGASAGLATVIGYGLSALVAAYCFKVGRAGRDRAAFALSVGGVLLATPISWLHYFALLLVPLALTRPRLGALWLLPLLMFGCPPTQPATAQIILVLGLSALVLGLAVRGDLMAETRTVRTRRGWQPAPST